MDMQLPMKQIAVAAAIGSYVLVVHAPNYVLSSRPTFVGTFVQLFILLFVARLFYQVVLYPRYFSPLRHLPGPKVSTRTSRQAERSGI